MVNPMNDEERTKTPPEIVFTYQNADNYQIIYVNGAQGGLTGNHEIQFDLYQESRLPPEKQSSDSPELVRERKVGIIMSMTTAKAVHQWLGGKLEQYEQISNQSVQQLMEQETDDADNASST